MAVPDPYAGMGQDLLSPAANAFAVTNSDTVQFQNASKRLFVGTGGAVKLITVSGQTVTYGNVPSGYYLYVRAVQVFATNTTASNIVAEY